MKVSPKILLILFIIGFHPLNGCQSDKKIKIGVYRSRDYNRLELYWYYFTKGIWFSAIGDELNIKPDSTYQYTTCGNIHAGNWYTRNDSLFLIVTTNQWRNDSLRKYSAPPLISKIHIGFKINDDELERIWLSSDGKKHLNNLKINMPK